MRHAFCALALASFIFAIGPHMSSLPLSNGEPLSPGKERLTFALPPGFRAELVASEPNVTDPVAMAFDENGRLFVAEMSGYPNGGVGTGKISSGRIRMLEDRDGDGVYETSSVWADGLRFPTALMPWRGGLLVANPPDLVFIAEAKAKPKVLYTGFDVANIQQLLNSFTLGIDGMVHACAGGAGGLILAPGVKGWKPLVLRGRGIRFDPDRPGSLEPTSGGGQFGLTRDDFGRWFTSTNSQHLRHIVLADEDLRRNPRFAAGATTLDIPEHGAACKVLRTSPFEAWRLERTDRRAGSPGAKGYPPTELFPGGYSTSACSPLYYSGGLFPREYQGSVFICDPANNAILRDTLTPKGATFTARRGDEKAEFMTSTDNWFRPVALSHGPDGAMYVLDFYREVIETPLSLPDDIKKRVVLKSQGKGRIWRITTASEGTKPGKVAIRKDELVKRLDDGNAWWRETAFRLLLQAPAGTAELRKLAREGRPAGKVLAMSLLNRKGEDAGGLDDAHPGVREVALRFATKVTPTLLKLADDADTRVRFQAALALGNFAGQEVAKALARIASRKDNDSWTRSAVLSSCSGRAGGMFARLEKDAPLRAGMAELIGASANDADITDVLKSLDETRTSLPVLAGLCRGFARSGRAYMSQWDLPAARTAVKLLGVASADALDGKRPVAERVAAVAMLGQGPFGLLEKAAAGLLSPTSPPQVQLAAVQALSAQPYPQVPKLLLAAWGAAAPGLRREITEAMFARPARVVAFVDAMERGVVRPVQVDPARLAHLRRLPDLDLRLRAVKALSGAMVVARVKVVDSYSDALKLKGDEEKGRAVFGKHCASCHRLDGKGHEVGADLLSALRTKTPDRLLVDILDPSREADPRYLTYLVRTTKGTSLTGMIKADTATSITLRRGDGVEDVILREQIEKVESTGKSLMPEGLEEQIDRKAMADLIAYLMMKR